ncbi:MAG: pre-peptidase C-terminal domain-containing protein [Planctomycetaceae bacterium]|nr:pre-peptidase C-terminal domain-containing protein [Planctomycetaceae bacterium]
MTCLSKSPVGSAIVALVLLAGGMAEAANPTLAKVTPRGAQRGTEVEVLLVGDRLDDAQELVFYQPGIEVAELTVVDAKQVKAKLKIAADCYPGTKYVRVRTKTGLSELQNFRVGVMPNVAEVEPNNEFTAPQAIEKNVTIEGVITSEDQDLFVIDAKQGERISVEVEGIRLADFMFDPYVAILNEQRFELASSDDAALVWQDGVASILAPADGKYIVQVRESSYGGNGNCHYRLHVGNFPRPLAIIPSGGKPGETLKVTYLGDARGPLTNDVTIPSTWAERDFAVFAQDELGIAPSGNIFRISPLDNFVEPLEEANETRETATPMTLPGAANGVIRTAADQDYFKFTATKGQVFDVKVFGRQLRSEIDPVLYIQNAGGGNVAANDDANGTPDSALRLTIPADGDYFLHIKDHLGRGGDAFHYRVEFEPVTPTLEASVNEITQFVEHRLVVAQGNRAPLVVTATRRDFGGRLTFLGENLPEGVTVEAPGMQDNQNTTQVTLLASPEAPLSAKLSKLFAKLDDANNPYPPTGEIRQDATLVRGQNNRPFWTEPLPGLVIGVVEKAPFTVEIVQPKVPLVQNGQMHLKVVAHRDEGFTAPIKVDLGLNPPGVNSSREVSIAEGQTEALILMNAAGNAPPGEWDLCIRAEAPYGNGRIVVGSPFAKLTVSEPFLKFNYASVAAVETGAETVLPIQIEVAKPFEGDAKVTLVGLPNKVTTEEKAINTEVKELLFPVKAEADANPGLTKNLFCQVVIMKDGEPILHNLGSGQLRVDKPLPPKPNAQPVAEAPKPAAPAAPVAKPLSRLEMLRQQQKEKLAAESAAPGGQ